MKSIESIAKLLHEFSLTPILVDVGASGNPPLVWRPISKQSVYIGFDPDRREMKDIAEGIFKRTVIVNKAVTDQADAEQIHFYLTRSPFCSSTLRPNPAVLSDYVFAELFAVEREVDVPATTLDQLLDELHFPHIDWLKLDTQGTDMLLIKSISENRFSRLLALDIEPGLMSYYIGENLFCELHPYLVESGFWLSNMKVEGAARMRPETLQSLGKLTKKWLRFEESLKRSPGWIEARYLRDLEHIHTHDQHLTLWVFALLDNQIGYALDIASQFQKRFNDSLVAVQMQDIAMQFHTHRPALSRRLLASIKQLLRSSATTFLRRTWRSS